MTTISKFFKKMILSLMLIVCSFVGKSDALSLYRPSWSQLLQQAEVIVWAKVHHNRILVLSNGFPVTQTTFHVLKTYRGSPGSSVTLSLLGGKTQTIQVKLPSIPTFQINTQVILLLRMSQHTRQMILVALYYGIFDLVRSGTQIQAVHRGKLLPAMPLSALEAQFQPSSISTPLAQKTLQTEKKPTTKPTSRKP